MSRSTSSPAAALTPGTERLPPATTGSSATYTRFASRVLHRPRVQSSHSDPQRLPVGHIAESRGEAHRLRPRPSDAGPGRHRTHRGLSADAARAHPRGAVGVLAPRRRPVRFGVHRRLGVSPLFTGALQRTAILCVELRHADVLAPSPDIETGAPDAPEADCRADFRCCGDRKLGGRNVTRRPAVECDLTDSRGVEFKPGLRRLSTPRPHVHA